MGIRNVKGLEISGNVFGAIPYGFGKAVWNHAGWLRQEPQPECETCLFQQNATLVKFFAAAVHPGRRWGGQTKFASGLNNGLLLYYIAPFLYQRTKELSPPP